MEKAKPKRARGRPRLPSPVLPAAALDSQAAYEAAMGRLGAEDPKVDLAFRLAERMKIADAKDESWRRGRRRAIREEAHRAGDDGDGARTIQAGERRRRRKAATMMRRKTIRQSLNRLSKKGRADLEESRR